MAQQGAVPQMVGDSLPPGRPPLSPARGVGPALGASSRQRGFRAGGGSRSGALRSCLGLEMERPFRINGLLVDTRVASLLWKARLLPSGGTLGYQPLWFDLHCRERGPHAEIHPAMPSGPPTALVKPRGVVCLPAGGPPIATLVCDIDRLWALWTWVAEEVLWALSCLESNAGARTAPAQSPGGLACAPGATGEYALSAHIVL